MVWELWGNVGGVTGGGVLIDQEEEELKGEVSIFDLCSSSASWGRVKRVTLSLSELRHVRRKHFQSLRFSLTWREKKTSEHSFNTTFSVCIPSLNPPAQKSQNQTKECLKKETERGTAARYTHKRDPFWWYIQSLCEEERNWASPLTGRGWFTNVLCVCDYLH